MAWLRAGTVAVTNGSATVTGTGTGFAANTRVGDAFIGPDGRQYELANVASDTVISIIPAYQGATASAASYAIMPVQGYQKGLADQVRDWINVYGAKMAALGTTGNYDILPLAKGGTGNTTGTATKLSPSAILGTVSQSGGTPTGAIFEYGSNGTGEFWKFANGLMITSQTISAPALTWSATSTHRYVNFTAGTPATFIATPRLSTNLMDSDVAGRAAWLIYAGATGVSSMTVWLGAPIGTTGSGIIAMTVLATGRWF